MDDPSLVFGLEGFNESNSSERVHQSRGSGLDVHIFGDLEGRGRVAGAVFAPSPIIGEEADPLAHPALDVLAVGAHHVSSALEPGDGWQFSPEVPP